jgi:hypothetical protein
MTDATLEWRLSVVKLSSARFQYSLLGLFIAITMVSLVLGVFASRVRRKQQAIETLEAMGASILYDYQRDEAEAYIPDAISPGDAWIKSLLGDKYASEPIQIMLCKAPEMSPEKFGDAEARQLSALTELRSLQLHDTEMTVSFP